MRMLLVREAVRKYNVIIATCVGSGHEMFDDVTFERVIIDECAQSIGASVTVSRQQGTTSFIVFRRKRLLDFASCVSLRCLLL